MSKLSKKDASHIAKLAKLKLSDAEVEKYSGQLGSVLEYMELLDEVDVSGVESTAQVSGLSNVFREDKVEKSKISDSDIRRNAPRFDNESFVVPGVFKDN